LLACLPGCLPAWLPACLPACLPCLPGGLRDCLTAPLPLARSLLLPSIRSFSLCLHTRSRLPTYHISLVLVALLAL
ncbi:hypothetical protein ALC60_03148, partial [Trachymyrmex zeteki]